jgi:hypothetical protein
MDRTTGARKLLVVLAVLAGLMGTATVFAQEEGTSGALGGLAEPDTVRTNLWLTRALMGEIVTRAAASLPPGPAGVALVQRGAEDSDVLFGVVAADILAERDYELFVAEVDSLPAAGVDYFFAYQVVSVELAYPEVGRTLGIWRRWVGRDLSVTASIQVSAAAGGRLLFKDIVERSFSDRVDNRDFDQVGSDLYEFTDAETAGSGWQNRMEEIIVLGTLVGLIAIYFANTGS